MAESMDFEKMAVDYMKIVRLKGNKFYSDLFFEVDVHKFTYGFGCC